MAVESSNIAKDVTEVSFCWHKFNGLLLCVIVCSVGSFKILCLCTVNWQYPIGVSQQYCQWVCCPHCC